MKCKDMFMFTLKNLARKGLRNKNIYIFCHFSLLNRWHRSLVNPLRAKFFRGSINIYLHFV